MQADAPGAPPGSASRILSKSVRNNIENTPVKQVLIYIHYRCLPVMVPLQKKRVRNYPYSTPVLGSDRHDVRQEISVGTRGVDGPMIRAWVRGDSPRLVQAILAVRVRARRADIRDYSLA